MGNINVSEVKNWARDFLLSADKELTSAELKEQKMFASLVQNPKNKILLSKLLDESSQIRDNKKLSRRMKKLLEKYGVPDFFGGFDQLSLQVFNKLGYLFDDIAVPIFKDRLRKETSQIIISEERPALTEHLAHRWEAGIGQNVNLLGEVVLGDVEAEHRYKHYLEALCEHDINYISVKLSGIYAQLHPLSYEKSKAHLCERVSTIYQQAISNPYIDKDGQSQPKFVNLDMEEYKDAELTLDVFITVLGMPQFKNYTAGIVVQAYLPDAGLFYDRLLAFAQDRLTKGGAPIKVRLVKGANLQMETIVSSLKGWPNPVLSSKTQVDANYLHLLDKMLLPKHAEAVHVGVASHNFFTIGYAFLLSQKNNVTDYVTFEMLEGMANHLPRVMKKLQRQVILYTPVVTREHFLNAVSYLVRRMDENTGDENFLRYSFNLKLDSKEWDFLSIQFEEAYRMKDSMEAVSYRTQDRTKEPVEDEDINTFHSEPDTDLDLKVNREWALAALKKWENTITDRSFIIPVQIGDKEVYTDKKYKYYDRSREGKVCVCEANQSSKEHIEEIIKIAEDDKSGWRKTSLEDRNKLLHKVATTFSARRGDLVGCMAAITGKTFLEGDVEVSEGTDFCRFYPISMKLFDEMKTVSHTPKGVILVIPPWNFPFAIPVGGVAAALAGGNTVILKPATVALPIAWEFAKCFWDAGIPKDALQVVCPAERDTLDYLSSHPSIKQIIFTGGTDTAFHLLKNSPRTPLAAEAGGKDAIILTGSGDQAHAILNVVHSAFGNAGQKCSACSLLLVDKKTYEDEAFKSKLRDAVTSMHTGSVWKTDNLVGPMVTNKNDKLMHAIENLEDGESWLVPPVFLDEKKYILKPCVKWGVKPHSYTFKTELFAPLLAVVCIDDLKQGVDFVNSSDYGLTSGLQSLDEDEIAYWKDNLQAGNLYINRGITGAIVKRQPFGGMKRSAFGDGIKAGGPNYVSCFIDFKEKPLRTNVPISDSPLRDFLSETKDIKRLDYAMGSYLGAWKNEFSQEKETVELIGELNTFRYLPLKNCVFRIQEEDELCDILLVISAALVAETMLTVSISGADMRLSQIQEIMIVAGDGKLVVESESEFIRRMYQYERVRSCSSNLSDAVYNKAAELGVHIAAEKPLVEGRIELLHYLKEQSISYEYHRYGSVFDLDK